MLWLFSVEFITNLLRDLTVEKNESQSAFGEDTAKRMATPFQLAVVRLSGPPPCRLLYVAA